MDDLISRQSALDWLEDEWDGMVVHVFDGIKNIPPAHCDNCPYPNQYVPQEDAVSRKGLKHIFETWLTVKGYNDAERNIIKAALYELQFARSVISSVQPEIVLCKDCRWHKTDINQCGRQICAVMYDDDYCSYAEQKDGDTDE